MNIEQFGAALLMRNVNAYAHTHTQADTSLLIYAENKECGTR